MPHHPPPPPPPPPPGGHGPDVPGRRRAARTSDPGPILPARDAGASVLAAERLATLGHELCNLLDGSMRSLGLVSRALREGPGTTQQRDEVRRRVEAAYTALERMTGLVRAALNGTGTLAQVESPLRRRCLSLAEALSHAVEVMGACAADHGVEIRSTIDEELTGLPAGPVYGAALNALRNAVESVASTGRGGEVEVAACVQRRAGSEGAAARVVIEVRDDGRGLPEGVPPGSLFEFGMSTKPGGSGIGLAVVRDVARELGGTAELLPRTSAAGRSGAVLRLTYPAPQPMHATIG